MHNLKVSALVLSPCLPWSPFLLPFVGWCVRLSSPPSRGRVSHCLPFSPRMRALAGWLHMVACLLAGFLARF